MREDLPWIGIQTPMAIEAGWQYCIKNTGLGWTATADSGIQTFSVVGLGSIGKAKQVLRDFRDAWADPIGAWKED